MAEPTKSPIGGAAIEHAALHAAIAEAESATHAHFAVSVIPISDRYALYPVVWGTGLALLCAGGLALAYPALSLRLAFLIEVGVFGISSLVLDWLPLRLKLVPKHIRASHAENLARREFAARILSAPQHGNGILLFVSVAERYVEIIADRELRARVNPEDWKAIVASFVADAKAKTVQQALLAAIASCREILTAHYPLPETTARP